MRTILVTLLGFSLLIHASEVFSQPDDGFVGVYGNASGGNPCITVPPLSSATLYVVGKLKGASANGITGVEFRIEVTNPAGWSFNYSPPAGAAIVLGSPMDTDPSNPDDGTGINLAFSECQQGQGSKVDLGTIFVVNISGGPTDLLVKRHSTPRNAGFACPLFTLCDAPILSKSCMTPSSDPPCPTLSPSKAVSLQSQSDPVVFSMSLTPEEAMPPGSLRLPREPRKERIGGLSLAQSFVVEDIVGNMSDYPAVGKMTPNPAVIQADTVWFADWNFDAGGSCNEAGWTKADNRILNDGTNYWFVSSAYAGTYPSSVGIATINGNAAVLGFSEPCFVSPLGSGYGNGWDYAISIKYRGQTQLAFDLVTDAEYLLDDEGQIALYDGISLEIDPGCSCCGVDYDVEGPDATAAERRIIPGISPIASAGANDALRATVTLNDLGQPNVTHCAFIRFVSDQTFSPQTRPSNHLVSWYLGAALVVDNIQTSGGPNAIPINETFDNWTGNCNQAGTVCLINSAENGPFGEWARLYPFATDNEVCANNKTCSWIFTDHTTPTLANDPSTAYGPGGFVIRNWLDDAIISPWVNISAAGFQLQDPIRLPLSFRVFPGNRYQTSNILLSWSMRGKKGPGCSPSLWMYEPYILNSYLWSTLTHFNWATAVTDMIPRVDRNWTEVQVRLRVTDSRWFFRDSYGSVLGNPVPWVPGPGPYIDRVRLGKVTFPGPVITGVESHLSQVQAQDAFATVPDTQFGGAGERFKPSTDRFGSCAFSAGADIFQSEAPEGSGQHLFFTPGDSILIQVVGRPQAAITSLRWFGAIVAGPHAGKSPPPWTIGAHGFFEVTPDSVRDENGAIIEDLYFVDLDDTYFRGGDALRYFWLAEDPQALVSAPPGLTVEPTSLQQVEAATGGLLEVNFLPTIDWHPSYLARIAADPHGDLDPTSVELSGSSQERCILYVNRVSPTRRTGDVNRTSFMYTLDRLGYRDKYDVYDVMGLGSANNDLASRAQKEQAQGYALIIHDTGRGKTQPLPRGTSPEEKVDQAGWYRNWLDQAPISSIGQATLWLIGEDLVQSAAGATLLTTYAGVALAASDQGLTVNPDVRGVSSMTFDSGSGPVPVYFVGDRFTVHGGCPETRDYDGLAASSSGVVTHQYQHPSTGYLGNAAIIMNKNAGANWNTIVMSFPFFDIVPLFDPQPSQPSSPTPGEVLMSKILSGVLPLGCLQGPDPVDVPDAATIDDRPTLTYLYQNTPNPFNPTTRINFDLAAGGHIELRIFDVDGRLVRTLIDEEMPRKRHSIVWDGLDGNGNRIASGVYFYRLRSAGLYQTRKLVVLR